MDPCCTCDVWLFSLSIMFWRFIHVCITSCYYSVAWMDVLQFGFCFCFFETEFRCCYPDWSAIPPPPGFKQFSCFSLFNSGITGMRHHAQLIFVFLLASCDPLTSACLPECWDHRCEPLCPLNLIILSFISLTVSYFILFYF